MISRKYNNLILATSFLALVVLLFVGNVSKSYAQSIKDNECITLTTNLKIDSTDITTSGQVSALQSFLARGSYLIMPVNTPFGYFRELTLKAVTDFQKANGIEATGFVGPLTRAEISNKSCDSTVNPPDSPSYIIYTSFIDGQSYKLYPAYGRNVVFLRAKPSADLSVMNRIVDSLDKAYDYYKQSTGKTPQPHGNYNGLDSFAVVNQTCGGACTLIGEHGTELIPVLYDTLYNGVLNSDQYDQALFYELGRSFWFYGNKILYVPPDSYDTIRTGYAVVMRFFAMDAAGLHGGPFGAIPFEIWKQNFKKFIDIYASDNFYNWSNTLKIGSAPQNSSGFQATDLFGSLVYRLADVNGGASYIQRLWHSVDLQPFATSTQAAVDNFVVAASQAANANLYNVFTTLWKWPVSQNAQNKLDLLGQPVAVSPYAPTSFYPPHAHLLVNGAEADANINFGQSVIISWNSSNGSVFNSTVTSGSNCGDLSLHITTSSGSQTISNFQLNCTYKITYSVSGVYGNADALRRISVNATGNSPDLPKETSPSSSKSEQISRIVQAMQSVFAQINKTDNRASVISALQFLLGNLQKVMGQ